ncbi:MAG: WYL domain-containing transcriptional regulator [Nitrospirae bacterium]|nr:MAG: WYL domain-containing transcriptional regulator [Nitrospirota bacterium]
MAKKNDPRFHILMDILRRLDRREPFTKQDIMEEYGISESTFHRYRRTLVYAGYPIEWNDKQKCYRFPPEYCLSKPKATHETKLVFALAKMYLGAIDPELKDKFEEIEEKVFSKKSGLPAHIVIKHDGFSERASRYFEQIQGAFEEFRRLMITYKALYSDEVTKRKIDPYYLFYEKLEGTWNLRAYCHLREDFRTFALDRILKVEVLDEYFLPRRIDKDEELYGAFGSYVDGDPVDVVLRFSPEIKPYVLRKRWLENQEQKELKDGSLEMRFEVNGIEGIRPWIYRWIPYVEVLEPEELRQEMREELTKALEILDKKSDKRRHG